MTIACFIPDSPKDWIDAVVQVLKLIFGDSIPPMFLRAVGCVLAFGLLLLGVWGVLAVASKIKALWLEQFWPLFYDSEEIQRRELRRRFADHIESEIRRLNNLEQWSDHRFAELEAEVEAEGSRAGPSLRGLLGLRQRNTLRREDSLSEALENSAERLILLEGDPGSGKSVALRHLTKTLSSKAMSARRVDSPIPIYVNLKELSRSADQNVSKDLIRSFVLHVLNRTNSRDVSEFLDQQFDVGLRDGTWIFLFDSFDETPEVLSSVEADRTIKAYAEAIADFLGGFNRCRGIVASRQFRGPGRLGWGRFRILPLGQGRKRELVRKAALDTSVEANLLTGLRTATTEILAMAGNPMFLGLLIEYIRVTQDFPENAHVVFERYIQNRFDRDADKILKRFGLAPPELRAAAESAAFCMAGDPGLGLSPARDALKVSVLRMGFRWSEAALNALEFMKIARSDPNYEVGVAGQFSFSHMRFQEYFATCVVLREPHRVSPEALLTNGRWRETTVVLCQTQPLDTLISILVEAKRLVMLMRGPVEEAKGPQDSRGKLDGHPRGFVWPATSIHVLGLLQDASSGKRELIQGFSDDAGIILLAANKCGNTLDRIWATEIAGVASDSVLLQLLRGSFRSQSRWLHGVAFRQAARLAEIPPDVAKSIRVALMRLAAEGRLLRERTETCARLARLGEPKQFFAAVRLLEGVFFVDFFLFCIYVLGVLRVHPLHGLAEKAYGGLFLAVSLILVFLTPYMYVRLLEVDDAIRRKAGSKAGKVSFALTSPPVSSVLSGVIPARLMGFMFLTMMLLTSPATLQLTALFDSQWAVFEKHAFIQALFFYWVFWAPMALFSVRIGKFMELAWWPLLPCAPFLHLISDPRSKLRALLREIRSSWKFFIGFLAASAIFPLAAALLASRVQEWYRKHAEWVKSHLQFGVGASLALFVGLPLAATCTVHGVDYLSWRRWKRGAGSGPIDARALFDLLKGYRTTKFRVRLLGVIRQQGRIAATPENETALLELAYSIERTLGHSEESGNGRRLNWGSETADAVYRLVEQVSNKGTS
jgi:hypothetical protein